jgi:hypothetical protein
VRSGRVTRARRLRRLLGISALALVCVGAVPSTADPGSAGATPHPALGSLDRNAVLMGAAASGDPGEAWAYRLLPQDVPPPSSPPSQAQFAPAAGSPFGQLVFMRYTDASGVWSVFETPRKADGQPYRGFTPNPLSARITPHGGGLLIGSDPTAPAGQRVVVLAQDPGGRFTLLPQPPASVLHAGTPGVADEVLATSSGTGRVAAAPIETSGHTEVFAGILGPAVEGAVAHWDGTAWTREPVEVPANSATSFHILALAATAPDNAWLLAQEDPGAGTGVALYHRVQTGSGPTWQRATLPATSFGAAATASAGIANVAALTTQAQPLTVSGSALWVDLRFTASSGGGHGPGGTQFDATVGYDLNAHTATTFCDASDSGGHAVCEHRLGIQFDDGLGYRSFAFDGSGLGTRVITDTLPPTRSTTARMPGLTAPPSASCRAARPVCREEARSALPTRGGCPARFTSAPRPPRRRSPRGPSRPARR